MTLIAESLVALGLAHLLAGAGLAVFQRRLQYFPDARYTELKTTGLRGGEELRLTTDDGETLIAWHFSPKGAQPLIVYFHGNGGALVDRVSRFEKFLDRGSAFSLCHIAALEGPRDRPRNAACCWMAKPAIMRLLRAVTRPIASS